MRRAFELWDDDVTWLVFFNWRVSLNLSQDRAWARARVRAWVRARRFKITSSTVTDATRSVFSNKYEIPSTTKRPTSTIAYLDNSASFQTSNFLIIDFLIKTSLAWETGKQFWDNSICGKTHSLNFKAWSRNRSLSRVSLEAKIETIEPKAKFFASTERQLPTLMTTFFEELASHYPVLDRI